MIRLLFPGRAYTGLLCPAPRQLVVRWLICQLLPVVKGNGTEEERCQGGIEEMLSRAGTWGSVHLPSLFRFGGAGESPRKRSFLPR